MFFMSGALKYEQCRGHCHTEDLLKGFLSSAKQATRDNFKKFKTVHIVIGNEACDLDSTVSAIAFAYFKSKVNTMCDAIHVPVLNITRDDFRLRSDVVYVLSQHGISDNLLTFRSDFDLHSLYHQGKLSLSLVDFHVFPKKDELVEKAVVEIIDHRKQEKSFDKSAIIADTVCMSETAGKKTEDDEAMARRLEELEPELANTRQKIFDDILRARRDVSGLTLLELFRKDLKIISSDEMPRLTVAISAIEEDLQIFLGRQEVEKNLTIFSKQHSASAAMLMFLSIDSANELSRQLAVYSTETKLRQEICRLLENSEDPNLLLSKTATSLDHSKFTVYVQGNKAASRKAILPIIKTNLNNLSKLLSS